MKLPRYQPEAATSTRYLFFTGKGGVGKTSLSCATALQLVREGKRVLLVSTDPASNLDEVLGVTLLNRPTAVPGAPGLEGMNINPVEAAAAYRERVIGPMRGLLPEAALRSMEEQLSGSCTVEIAAFDEFSGWIGDPVLGAGYDHIVFDTAPTGHTLRLMSLAKAWDHYLNSNSSGTSCLGPLAGLAKQRAIYEATVRTLADAGSTTLILVSRPQVSALREAERTSRELRDLGVQRQILIINGAFETQCPEDQTAQALEKRGSEAMRVSSAFIGSLPAFVVPLRAINILGLDGLTELLKADAPHVLGQIDNEPNATRGSGVGWTPPAMLNLEELVKGLEHRGKGVIMTMGKGGVGKTTIAASIAVMLGRRGHAVHLSTTDPAAHLQQTLHGTIPQLTVSRIDPGLETEKYRQEVMERTGSKLDEASRALMEEDLRSPCTEEIAVFRAFAREVELGDKGFVVLDTAPTGHTLLLLDSSEAHHRELQRQARSTQPESVMKLLERLRDPTYTHVLLVTLAEATPVHEAADLQKDLRRAAIEPYAWVINQSLFGCGSCDPLLKAREQTEARYIQEIVERQSNRTVWIGWKVREPIGEEALAELATSSLELS